MPATRWSANKVCLHFFYDSCGAGQIHGLQWEPAGQPRGIVQIVHGISDHGERYDHFARYLTKAGFLVVAEDHMGHGRSGGEGTCPGYFNGGWFCAVDDTYRLLEMTRMEFPNVPYILFGHSMGSFICRTILQKYPQSGLSGCILCGTGWQPRVGVNAAAKICEAICSVSGDRKPSPRVQELLYDAFNMRVERPRTDYDWVCRDKKVVDAYMADPLCQHLVTAGLARDMLIGISYIQEEENLKNMDRCLPVLLVSGGDDPVGGFGEGVRKTAESFVQVGMEKVSVKIYPLCRHEILNEINKGEIYRDILNWIDNLFL